MPDTTTLTVIATSYPRNTADWQGIFIKRLTDAMGDDPTLSPGLWAPPGPRHPRVSAATNDSEGQLLLSIANQGGIIHQLRSSPVNGVMSTVKLLSSLRKLYLRDASDILHINWLQNALPLTGLGRRAVISVLGSDFKLLSIPGMVPALRRMLSSNRCVIAPNAPWMVSKLEDCFGDLCAVSATNFGIDQEWFDVTAHTDNREDRWLCVTRVTRDKIGHLFDWGAEFFSVDKPLDLIGPNQGGIPIPDWVRHHGPVEPERLRLDWFPRARGLLSLSYHSEGRPQVMLEAMAAGLPIVALRQPAHENTVEHGVTGHIVDTQADFLESLRTLDSVERRKAMGTAAKEVALQQYGSWRDCVDRYKLLYETI